MSDELESVGTQHRNQVHIVGRVADEPAVRTLPSGDEIVTVRVVVDRPPPETANTPRGSVDTLSCTAWSPEVQRSLRECAAGETVEIHGALRRRFWRTAAGLNNTYDVEVVSAELKADSYA
jgi:single-strand DNA-binding protein